MHIDTLIFVLVFVIQQEFNMLICTFLVPCSKYEDQQTQHMID